MRWPSISVVNWGYWLSCASWRAPVVPRAPVLGELLEVVQRYAAGPLHAGQLAGPAGVGEPVVQVVEVGLGNLDAEGVDLVAHRVSPRSGRDALLTARTLGTIAEEDRS